MANEKKGQVNSGACKFHPKEWQVNSGLCMNSDTKLLLNHNNHIYIVRIDKNNNHHFQQLT